MKVVILANCIDQRLSKYQLCFKKTIKYYKKSKHIII